MTHSRRINEDSNMNFPSARMKHGFPPQPHFTGLYKGQQFLLGVRVAPILEAICGRCGYYNTTPYHCTHCGHIPGSDEMQDPPLPPVIKTPGIE